jgi:hypothetical protein
LGFVDDTHTSAANLLENSVVGDSLSHHSHTFRSRQTTSGFPPASENSLRRAGSKSQPLILKNGFAGDFARPTERSFGRGTFLRRQSSRGSCSEIWFARSSAAPGGGNRDFRWIWNGDGGEKLHYKTTTVRTERQLYRSGGPVRPS